MKDFIAVNNLWGTPTVEELQRSIESLSSGERTLALHTMMLTWNCVASVANKQIHELEEKIRQLNKQIAKEAV